MVLLLKGQSVAHTLDIAVRDKVYDRSVWLEKNGHTAANESTLLSGQIDSFSPALWVSHPLFPLLLEGGEDAC